MPILIEECVLPSVRITEAHQHSFFGYYDKSPWDRSGRWMLGMRSEFIGRPPTEGDRLEIGLIDTEQNFCWKKIAATKAWNWQQGCMLQWLGDGSSGKIIFNDRINGRFVSRIVDVFSLEEQVLQRSVYAVNRIGTSAISLNFSRLQHQRPGYGYAGVPDAWEFEQMPKNDGLYAIDLKTGESRFIFSLADAAQYQPLPGFESFVHRFNHVQFGSNPDRFAFLHRFKEKGSKRVGMTRLITMNTDGSSPCVLSDHGLVSHYDWQLDSAIVAWAHRNGMGDHYYLFQDRTDKIDLIGRDCFDGDGHCSFSPDGKWILTDTYPNEMNIRTLILFHIQSGRRFDIGHFFAPPMSWDIRCDLHPRWSRDGQKVCIDSQHEGYRGMYQLDVSSVLGLV